MIEQDQNVAPDLSPIEPSEQQVTNCHSMGWTYLGGGYFEKGDRMACWTSQGWGPV